MSLNVYQLALSCLLIYFAASSNGVEKHKEVDLKAEVLLPCKACKTLISSITNGMANTNKKHFGGGDTAWEETKLGDYEQSEVRLIEVQEQLCSDVVRGQTQCYSLAEEWEQLIEEWWFKQKTLGDIHQWLCIDKVKYCCPDSHYGEECTPCQGYPDNVCSNNGKCKGSGTRKGNGDCICKTGYTGPICNQCALHHYESYKDENKVVCSKCHDACKDSCSSAGADGCSDCNEGWMKSGENGCLDVNECTSPDICKTNQFCVNTEGSFFCSACHESCHSCYGNGPDMCIKCAKGYVLENGLCIGRPKTSLFSALTHYLSYVGLCIATCIIFQKNTLITTIIGMCFVATYVVVSEYMLSK